MERIGQAIGESLVLNNVFKMLLSLKLHWKAKRLENDSTLGRPQSENANIGWAWPFQIVIHFNGTLHHTTKFQAIVWIPCISTMGHLSGPSLPRKILKFRRTSKNWPSMAMLNNGLLHGTVYHSAKFQADS